SPDGKSGDILVEIGSEADIVIFLWKLLGDNGLVEWNGGKGIEAFTRSQGVPVRRTVHHKSMFRPEKFGVCANHMHGEPLVDNIRLVNSAGDILDPWAVSEPLRSRYGVAFRHQTYKNACLHHYAVKIPDLFLVKNDRGD